MGKAICIDTDMIIYYLKGKDDEKVTELLRSQALNVFTTSINCFELRTGTDGKQKMDEFLSMIKVLDFDPQAAEIAAAIFLQLQKEGMLIDYRDLFIAATCIRHDCALLTNNKKHFRRIPGLELT